MNRDIFIPLISIIVPIYNVELYLHACIDSILAQTYPNLEIILVDDGSTDRSSVICDNYAHKDNRIKVLHKDNKGQGMARNAGIEIANGNWIGFVDSDDSILPDMYETMYRAIQTYGADLAICGIQRYFGELWSEYYPTGETRTFDNHELMREYLTTEYISGGQCNKLYKKELFTDIRFPAVRSKEDVYIMHELLSKVTRAVYIGECKYIYNVREGSTENSILSEEKLANALGCVQSQQLYINKNYPDLYKYVRFKLSKTRLHCIAALVMQLNVPGSRKMLKKMKVALREELIILSAYKYEDTKTYKYMSMFVYAEPVFIWIIRAKRARENTFKAFYRRDWRNVYRNGIIAILFNPLCIANRGMLKIILQSIINDIYLKIGML